MANGKRGKNRPADIRLREAEEKAARLRLRLVKEQVKENPQIQEMDKEIRSLITEQAKVERHIDEAPGKVEHFQNRAEEWRIRGEQAAERKPEVTRQLAEARSRRESLAMEIANSLMENEESA